MAIRRKSSPYYSDWQEDRATRNGGITHEDRMRQGMYNFYGPQRPQSYPYEQGYGTRPPVAPKAPQRAPIRQGNQGASYNPYAQGGARAQGGQNAGRYWANMSHSPYSERINTNLPDARSKKDEYGEFRSGVRDTDGTLLGGNIAERGEAPDWVRFNQDGSITPVKHRYQIRDTASTGFTHGVGPGSTLGGGEAAPPKERFRHGTGPDSTLGKRKGLERAGQFGPQSLERDRARGTSQEMAKKRKEMLDKRTGAKGGASRGQPDFKPDTGKISPGKSNPFPNYKRQGSNPFRGGTEAKPMERPKRPTGIAKTHAYGNKNARKVKARGDLG